MKINVTIVGNVVRDPELKQVGDKQVCNFTVAHNDRRFDKNTNQWVDGDSQFFRCAVWGKPAGNVNASLLKGMSVIVTGVLSQREYVSKEGEKRTIAEVAVDEVGPSLRFVTAVVQRPGDGWGGQQSQQQSQQWGGYTDEAPF